MKDIKKTIILTLALAIIFGFFLMIIIVANPYLKHFKEVPVRYFPEYTPTSTK